MSVMWMWYLDLVLHNILNNWPHQDTAARELREHASQQQGAGPSEP